MPDETKDAVVDTLATDPRFTEMGEKELATKPPALVSQPAPKPVSQPAPVSPMTKLGQALGAKPTGVVPPKPVPAAPRAIVPKMPATLKLGFTSELKEAAFLHALIYADTGMRKTTIACTFDDPLHTLVLATRRPEQLTPIRDMDYPYVEIIDAAALEYALLYPEALWADRRQARTTLGELRTLILDDGTEAVDQLLEGAEDDLASESGRDVKDRRRVYMRGKDDLRDVIKVVLRKPLNFVMTAVADVRENPITNEETVGPKLPPSMLAFIGTEFEFVFYIRPSDYKFTTERDRFSFESIDEKGDKKTYTRSILAKNKLPLALAKMLPPPIAKYEEADLRKVWDKVVSLTHKAAPAPPKKP